MQFSQAVLKVPFLLLLTFLSFGVQAQIIKGKVTYVSDGDTFHLLSESSEKIKVRVEGVDCPERNQPFGLEVKNLCSPKLKIRM